MSLRIVVVLVLGVGLLLVDAAHAAECGGSGTEGITVTESSGSYVCRPDSAGLFPGVLYSHGGLGLAVGGDLQGTCEALARAGYVAYAKRREDSSTKTILDHLFDVEVAFNFLLEQSGVDPYRIGVIGYSRGASLTYAIAESRNATIDATVLLAPAPAGTFFANKTADVTPLAAPVLVAVASNDIYQADHVGIAEALVATLHLEEKSYVYFPYPDYPNSECGGCDGHEIFQVVDDEFTDYWCDVEDFLAMHLAEDVPALEQPAVALAAIALALCGASSLGLSSRRHGRRGRS